MPSHPSPLDPLVQCADIQEQRIKALLGDRFLPSERDNRMTQLWDTFWGKSDLRLDTTEKVERDLPPLKADNSLTGEVVPDECEVKILPRIVNECWEIGCQKIFIRPDEYKETEESVVAASRQRRLHAFLVTGQPGIGLSLFHFVIAGS